MRRAPWLVSLALGLACGCAAANDPCATVRGACLGLRVTSGPELDQLEVELNGALHFQARTPTVAGKSQRPPLSAAIALPTVAGSIDLVVRGLLRGNAAGSAARSLVLVAGGRQVIDLALSSQNPDLGDQDGGVADLAGSDLASMDQGATDLSTIDLAGVEAGPPPRHVFLLPLHDGALGAIGALDTACGQAAASHAVGPAGAAYLALIAFPAQPDPATRIEHASGRMIVLPSGAAVATDASLFSGAHVGPINELADRTVVSGGCVWTAFGAAGNRLAMTTGDCTGWTDNQSTTVGYAGNPQSTGVQWAFDVVDGCDLSCHVYCIEQ